MPEHTLGNDIWVDVGNAVREGTFDHHQYEGMRSAFESVLSFPQNFLGVKRYISSYKGSISEIVIHLHEDPDTDCVVCAYAIQKMLCEGVENLRDIFSETVLEKSLEFVNDIDAGKKKIVSQMTLYTYLCRLVQNKDKQKRGQAIVFEGIK